MKQGTVKVPCACEHEFQDKIYGKGVRVMNTTAKGDDKNVDVRCTVCKRVTRVNRGLVR